MEMAAELGVAIAGSFTFWCIFMALCYLIIPSRVKVYQEMESHKKLAFMQAIVSSGPSFLVTPASIMAILTTDNSCGTVLTVRSKYSTVCIGISMGYLFFDFCVQTIGWRSTMRSQGKFQWWLYFFHHLLPLIGWPYAVMESRYLWFCHWMVLSEITTIFINVRYLLIRFGHGSHILFYINGFVFILMHFVIRILPIPYFLYQLGCGNWNALSPGDQAFGAMIPIPILLNLYWFYTIINVVVKLMRGNYADAAKDGNEDTESSAQGQIEMKEGDLAEPAQPETNPDEAGMNLALEDGSRVSVTDRQGRKLSVEQVTEQTDAIFNPLANPLSDEDDGGAV